MKWIRKICIILISTCAITISVAQHDSYLYSTPLSFYNTDILSYLQALHKNQQYEKMVPFFIGEARNGRTQLEFVNLIANAPFGYSMKRVGIREISKGQTWSLTYQRTILGTQETFKVDCMLVRDTCRIQLDNTAFKTIFISN